MERWLLSFLTGAILSLFLPIVPAIFYVNLVIGLTICCALLNKTRLIASALFGTSIVLAHATYYQQAQQTYFHEVGKGQSAIIVGEVLSVATKRQIHEDKPLVMRSSITLAVKHFNHRPTERVFNVKLNWSSAPPGLSVGQQWQLAVKLKPAHGLANLGGFSYQTWLRINNIHATGYVSNHFTPDLLAQNPTFRAMWLERLKNRLTHITTNDDENDWGSSKYAQQASLVLALAFGERQSLTPQQWLVLKNTGTSHLLAISGMHLSLVAMGAFFVITLFIYGLAVMSKNIVPHSLLTTNTLNLISIAMLITVAIYAYMAAFSLPTVRALVMIVIVTSARLLHVKLSLTRIILITVAAIIIIMPQSLYAISFWLSLYAVVVISLLTWRFHDYRVDREYSMTKRLIYWCNRLLLIQTLITLFMLPLVILVNQAVSLNAVFANLIAIPLVSFICLPLVLVGTLFVLIAPVFADTILYWGLVSLHVLWRWLEWVVTHLGYIYNISSVQWVILSLCGLVFFMSFHCRHYYQLVKNKHMNKARKSYTVNGAGVTSFIVVIGVSVFVTIAIIMKALDDAKARWQVYTLDVGQGLAVVIIKGRRAILYDTGASYPSGFNMVDAVIKPFLTFHGITHFDYVIISHLDNDHAGGLTKIVAEDLSQHIVVNQQTLNGKVNTCLQGKVITWQGLSIKALWPNHISARHNDDSCVIKITHPNGRILLTGDISKSVEKMLVTRFKADGTLDTDVLIAPHHGSLSSSSLAFLKASSPQFAIFSAGFINRWRHPRTEVMARYHAQKIKTYSTATDGMLKIDFTSRGIMVKRYRQEIWPFWFAN